MNRLTDKLCFRISAFILIHTFLLFDIAWAGGEQLSLIKQIGTLSAPIQISQQMFNISFGKLSEKITDAVESSQRRQISAYSLSDIFNFLVGTEEIFTSKGLSERLGMSISNTRLILDILHKELHLVKQKNEGQYVLNNLAVKAENRINLLLTNVMLDSSKEAINNTRGKIFEIFVDEFINEAVDGIAPDYMGGTNYKISYFKIRPDGDGTHTINGEMGYARDYLKKATKDAGLIAHGMQALEIYQKHDKARKLRILDFVAVPYRIIKLITGNEDADAEHKKNMDDAVQPVYEKLRENIEKIRNKRGHKEALFTAMIYATIGNYLDFSSKKGLEALKGLLELKSDRLDEIDVPELIQKAQALITEGITITGTNKYILINEFDHFYALLEKDDNKGGVIPYGHDNHGEVILDQLVMEELLLMGFTVVSVARGESVREDVTAEGLRNIFNKNPYLKKYIKLGKLDIVTDGTHTFGIDPRKAAKQKEFLEYWQKSIAFIAKGSGNYVSLFGRSFSLPGLFLRVMKRIETDCEILEELRNVKSQGALDLILAFQSANSAVSPVKHLEIGTNQQNHLIFSSI